MLGVPAQKAGIALQLLDALGSGLTQEQQIWLLNNLDKLPPYLKSKEGGEVMRAVIDCFRTSISRK
jgi:hypothetical protein